ncbi:hypothetical protein AB1N83_005600 [Pleurotus pulmonarius]
MGWVHSRAGSPGRIRAHGDALWPALKNRRSNTRKPRFHHLKAIVPKSVMRLCCYCINYLRPMWPTRFRRLRRGVHEANLDILE